LKTSSTLVLHAIEIVCNLSILLPLVVTDFAKIDEDMIVVGSQFHIQTSFT